LKEVCDCFELINGHLLAIKTDDGSSNFLVTQELKSTLQASGIDWPTTTNQIPCVAPIIQLALGVLMCSLSVTARTKYWEAHERDQQFGEYENSDIRKS